jgi:chromosomal replication initiator protein
MSEQNNEMSNEESAGAASGEGQAVWQRVRHRLRRDLGDGTFSSWVKPLALKGKRGGKVTFGVTTPFMRDSILARYGNRIVSYWRDEDPDIAEIEIKVDAPPRDDSTPVAAVNGANGVQASAPGGGRPSTAAKPAARSTAYTNGRAREGAPSLDFDAPLDARYTFDDFVVGKSNEFAHAAARRVAESPTVPFNPLFLYSSVGLGKTHLMHAIGHEIRRRDPSRKVLYLSAEKFMFQFVRALRYKDTMAFKQKFRAVDVLMIDDVQFISGKNSTQEEFFHTFNALIDHNRQVIISADRSPTDLEGIEERIRSRLGWGLVADIHPTDYELRLGILQSKAEHIYASDGIQVEPKILEFLAHKVMSNVRELEGSLNRVVAFATLVGRPITLEMTQEVLQDLLRASERKISIEEIQRKVAEYFNIRLADMHSARRARAVARPRQIAMYLAKQMTPRSLPEIGRKFGGRDHTTVMYAVRKIEELRAGDTVLDEDIDLLKRMLEA